MAAAGAPATVRLLLRPAARVVDLALSSPERPAGPLFWARAIVLAPDRPRADAIASVLAAGPPRLVTRRLRRPHREEPGRAPRLLYRPVELARLWSLPAPEFAGVPCLRSAIPVAPAPPGIRRARPGTGLLRDDHGAVTIAEPLRRQHVAAVGAVEQGKTSFLVASAAEDLRRENCAVIVLDPKGDAADAVLSIVPRSRTCTLLDMAAPAAGFNPLAARAAPAAIADHVVSALRSLFDEGEVRGSSDRYLRNALIAVLACGGTATLWDVARLLEVGDAGRTFRARVADRLVELPEYAELAAFFAHELPAQLADARAATTAKLDAPANKLARVLNSPSVKQVLLNDSLRIDFDRLIERREVLVVRGALGEIGTGNVAVLMQLLLGMLDAALGRQQDRRSADRRTAVALKIDEAPLVINAAFAQTLALKRSAGLETVACWQTDAQWAPELRSQLDALFAHRVLFATASTDDARSASTLLLAEYSDQLRAGDEQLTRLASPDVRLHLPRHVALASWTTARGRERPFIAATMPLQADPERIARHARAQRARGGRMLPQPQPPPAVIGSDTPRSGRPVVRSPGPATVALGAGPTTTAQALGSPVRSPHRHDMPGVHAPCEAPAEARSPRGETRLPTSPRAAAVAPQSGRARSLGSQRSPTQSPAPQSRPSPPRSRPSPPQSPSPTPQRPADTARLRSGGAQLPHVGPPPATDHPSFVELLALDAASRVRWLPVARMRGRPVIAPPDRELLAWVVAARCAMTSQIHRRVNPGRSLTTTQRALKRLADAGLIARFQLYRADGGGVPMCCAATAPAIAALGVRGRRAADLRDDRIDVLRRDMHVVGWLLALEETAGDVVTAVVGPGRATLAPGDPDPAQLRLEPGLRMRDFLVTGAHGSRTAVGRFAAVRPDAVVTLGGFGAGAARRRSDLFVVADHPRISASLEAYDHFLAGWWRSLDRYRGCGAPPSVVVVCRDEATAHARVALADQLLTACLAEIGVPPQRWRHPGRSGIRFASEPDLHRGSFAGWQVPASPPTMRSGRRCEAVRVELLQVPQRSSRPAAKSRWH
jgi:hypothetical protein